MTTYHRIIRGTVAVAAASALCAGAGSASARPYDLNGTGSYVTRAPGAPVAAAQPSSDRPSPTGKLSAPPILPAHTPAQTAVIQRAEQPQARRPTLPNRARYSSAEFNAYPSGLTTSLAILPDGGFDWGDAGIGAAGGFAIAMLAVAGGLALSQRRSHRTGTSAMVTG